MTRVAGRAEGYTVLEILIATLLGGVVLASMLSVMLQQQHFYLVVGDISETMGELQRIEVKLEPELLPLNPTAGDITFAGPDSISARVFRGVFAICAKETSPDVFITVRRLTSNSIPLLPDSAFVYSRGTSPSLSDDGWELAKLASVTPDVCPDGTPAWRTAVPDLNGVSSEIPIGGPVRVFHHGSYWLAASPDGWLLKTNATSGSATQIAGPLTPAEVPAPSTLRFRYFDTAGNITADMSKIARIEIEAAAEGNVPMRLGGQPHRSERRLAFKTRNN